jgi:hypothetical protein
LSFGEGLGRELLLLDDQLLVIGDVSAAPTARPAPANDMQLIAPWPQRTRLWLVDIGDPTQPDITSTMTLDGWTVATRLTGDVARVVVRSGLTPPDLEQPTTSEREAEQRALEANRDAIRNSDADDWLPRVEVDGGPSEPLVECEAVHEPPGFTDLATVTVLSLDMQAATLSPGRTQAVLGAADAVYANDERLYVSTSRWPFMFPGPIPIEPLPEPVPAEPLTPAPQADQGLEPVPAPKTEQVPEPAPLPTAVEPVPPVTEPAPEPSTVEPVPPATEPAPEPSTPVLRTPAPGPKAQTVTTEVHRFDLDGMNVDYTASGSVPGSLLNQWALSEHDGDLRIATTEEEVSGQASHSAVRVLRQRDGELREIGHVGDLGRGERIYAVRYAGDIGFVVTFRQVDPLYVVDLSDPTDPQVLGELKIPGYSAYLHPIGDDRLLGVGQSADQDGRTTGVQVSLFDVADRTSPRRIDQLRLGPDTMTSVEFDHRAFLYWPDEQLAVLPVDAWSQGKTGATVLTVDPEGGVAERGMVQHPPRDGVPPPVQRAFVVDDRLITVSPVDVLVSDLTTLDALGDVPFAG